jgi:hypothetical protein
MATNGGEGDESSRLDGSTRRGRAIAPLGNDGARWNRAKKLSAIQNRQRGLGLESDRVGDRVRGQPAGPGWSSQAHSG